MQNIFFSFMNSVDSNNRVCFSVFKSTICHILKESGDRKFLLDVLESNFISFLFDEKKWYVEGLYVLAMADYLCRILDLPIVANYNKYRSYKLHTPLYPVDVELRADLFKDDKYRKVAYDTAIPEFKRFNLIEPEVRNVI